jgi:Rieske Fe-S protein
MSATAPESPTAGFTCGRRAVLALALGAGLAVPARRLGAQPADPRKQRPQANDRFVFADGPRKGQVVTLADLPAGSRPVAAYPVDAVSGAVRDDTRLNQVLLVRLDPASLAGDTRARAAEGVVAYSAICTHAGCDVADWKDQAQTLMCFCHYSEFDPKDGARVLDGPAPRRLAALPLRVADGVLTAAGGFIGRVGFQQG